MQPIRNRTMLNQTHIPYLDRTPKEPDNNSESSNYCPLPERNSVDVTTNEAVKLMEEYDNLLKRLHFLRHRLIQFGFKPK